MAQFIEKVDAVQWWKLGDHPDVTLVKDSRYNQPFNSTCLKCMMPDNEHGLFVIRPEVDSVICPGWYIVRTSNGNLVKFPPEEFEEKYEAVTE